MIECGEEIVIAHSQQLPAYERETVDSAVRQVDFLDAEIAEPTG